MTTTQQMEIQASHLLKGERVSTLDRGECMEAVFFVIIVVISMGMSSFLAKRYDMSQKVDKGIELCYWKLSYRRKFIRTLWIIPFEVIVISNFCTTYQSYIFPWIIGTVLFLLSFIQAIYNYKKWKQESS